MLSKSQLEEKIYGWGEEIGSNTVEGYIHSLRKKLDPDHPQRFIQTRRGLGYILEEMA